MTVVRPPITGDHQQDSWMDQVTNLINSGFFTRDTFVVSQGSQGAQGARGVAGQDGFSSATLYLFQRQANFLPDTPPPDLATDLVYDYANNVLYEQGNRDDPDGNPIVEWDGWTQFIPDDPDNSHQYIWVITTNIADRQEQDLIPFTAWTVRTLLAVPTVSYDLESFGFDFIRANQNMVDVGVRAYRTIGETNAEITDLLNNNSAGLPSSTWVLWTKHSLEARPTDTSNPWVSGTTYARDDIVSRDTELPTVPVVSQPYNYVSLMDNNLSDPAQDGVNWRLADGSVDQRLDDIWNATVGMTSGTDLTISAADVLTQTEFRAVLDDATPLPYT